MSDWLICFSLLSPLNFISSGGHIIARLSLQRMERNRHSLSVQTHPLGQNKATLRPHPHPHFHEWSRAPAAGGYDAVGPAHPETQLGLPERCIGKRLSTRTPALSPRPESRDTRFVWDRTSLESRNDVHSQSPLPSVLGSLNDQPARLD